MHTRGSSDEVIEGAKQSPMWSGLEAIAHTLAYDAIGMGTNQPPTARLAKITQPTLVLNGEAIPKDSSMDELRSDFFGQAADPIEAGRINNFEQWESEEALAAWRAEANVPEPVTEILSDEVMKHQISESGPPFDE